MSDGAYLPLPDLNAYLDRIELEQEEPSLAYLDKLIYAHQCHVPFEGLDVYETGESPSLDIPALFDKIVVRRRGGYCFEMNGLFCSLLRALGFDVQAGFARVLLRKGEAHPGLGHRVSIIRMDGELYLADVGFGGPMPGFALKLADGFTRTEHGETYTAHKHGDHWFDIGYTGSSGEENLVLSVCTVPAEEVDFEPLSFFVSQNPQASFRNYRVVNLRTPEGSRALTDATYTEHVDGKTCTRELASAEELDRVLAEQFGITNWRRDTR